MQGKKKGCLISCLVVVALVITLICVVLFVITPNMLGLGDTEILNGQTLNDLGLGDMTVYKIITTIRDLTTPGDEHSILGGDVHTEKDLKSAAGLLGLEIGSDGTVNYDAILEGDGKLNQTDQDITLNNKEFASIVNEIVQNGGKTTVEPDEEQKNPILPELSTEITDEVRISGLQPVEVKQDVSKIKVTIGVDPNKILEKTGGEMPEELNGVISEGMSFITKEVALKKTETGYEVCLETETEDLQINGKEIEVVNNLLHSFIVEDEHGNESTAHDELHDIIHDAVVNLVNTLGVTDITMDGFVLGANLEI